MRKCGFTSSLGILGAAMLEPFDFSPIEETLYLALIDAGSLATAELARLTDISVEAVEPILARLEAVGVVTRLPGRPHRYSAIEPGIGLATLIAAQEQQVRLAEEQVERARATATQLAERFRLLGARRPLDLIEVVVGAQAAVQRFYQLQRMARTEIRAIVMPPFLDPDNNPVGVEMLGKGVVTRCVYDRQALHDLSKRDEIGKFVSAGEQARIIAGAPFKLTLADDQLAMIALTDESNGVASALLIAPSALLDGLSRLFETLWRFAVPLQLANPEPGADRPSPIEGELLALLAVGMTDKVIARRVGLGMRTVQKRVQQLMDHLDAETRFQAGVRAKARGWL